jgi:DNA-binding response OmpR family regulator
MPSGTDPPFVRFGEFELDLRSGELSTNGRRTVLPHQTFRLLAALIDHRGELVTRDDLRRELWSDDTFVDFERSLNAAIRRLRETLDDSAEKPRFIETLPAAAIASSLTSSMVRLTRRSSRQSATLALLSPSLKTSIL